MNNYFNFDKLLVIMLTQRRLQHLLVLAQYAHFGRAAQSLHISQPALTKSIQSLEAELGVTLLDRQRGAVALTAFGELVVKRSKSWLTAEDDLRREIAMLASNHIGSLRVAVGPYPSVISGFASAARLLEKHPSIRMTVQEASWFDIIHLLNAQTIDLGITEISRLNQYDHFVTETVGQHNGYFFCRVGHPLLNHTSIYIEQLLEFPWVAPRLPTRIANRLPKALGQAGEIDPATGDLIPRIEISTPFQSTNFLKSTDAITLSTLTAMERELRSGDVVILPLTDFPIQTNYGFVYLENRSLPPAAIAYMQEVRVVESSMLQREAELAKFLGLPSASAKKASA